VSGSPRSNPRQRVEHWHCPAAQEWPVLTHPKFPCCCCRALMRTGHQKMTAACGVRGDKDLIWRVMVKHQQHIGSTHGRCHVGQAPEPNAHHAAGQCHTQLAPLHPPSPTPSAAGALLQQCLALRVGKGAHAPGPPADIPPR